MPDKGAAGTAGAVAVMVSGGTVKFPLLFYYAAVTPWHTNAPAFQLRLVHFIACLTVCLGQAVILQVLYTFLEGGKAAAVILEDKKRSRCKSNSQCQTRRAR